MVFFARIRTDVQSSQHRELDALRPIDYDELIEAADLLEHFQDYWDQCDTVDDPLDARLQLLQKIVERVFVHDGNVLAVVLYGDFGVVLGENETASVEIADAIEKEMATNGVSITRSRCGSDGPRPLVGCGIVTGGFRLFLRSSPPTHGRVVNLPLRQSA
jgi:hypothetical protein